MKSKVLEIKEQTKTLSKERRHNRRLRRQLESIVAGDTVSGTVLKVTREGILVSISSLGSLNVTGIISKADLPKQYEAILEHISIILCFITNYIHTYILITSLGPTRFTRVVPEPVASAGFLSGARNHMCGVQGQPYPQCREPVQRETAV